MDGLQQLTEEVERPIVGGGPEESKGVQWQNGLFPELMPHRLAIHGKVGTAGTRPRRAPVGRRRQHLALFRSETVFRCKLHRSWRKCTTAFTS